MLKRILFEYGLNQSQAQAFKELLKITGCEEFLKREFESSLAMLEALKDTTQQFWLREPGKERWEQNDSTPMNEKATQFFKLFDELGSLKEKLPSKEKNYDYVILFGALESRVKTRINFLLKLWEEGVRFEKIIVLGGKRPLMEAKESAYYKLDDQDKTELNMMKWCLEETMLSASPALQRIKRVYINTPMQKKEDGSERRPNTKDTIQHWLKTVDLRSAASISILAISNQPYVRYQGFVLKAALQEAALLERCEVATVGHKAGDEKISIILDTIAREIFSGYLLVRQALQKKPEANRSFFNSRKGLSMQGLSYEPPCQENEPPYEKNF